MYIMFNYNRAINEKVDLSIPEFMAEKLFTGATNRVH